MIDDCDDDDEKNSVHTVHENVRVMRRRLSGSAVQRDLHQALLDFNT